MQLKHYFCVALTCLLMACGDSGQHYQGYIEGQNVFMASPFSGVLHRLAVVRGQMVHQGERLFELESDPQALNLKQAEKDLLQAQNTLDDLKKPGRAPEIAAIIAQIEQVNAEISLATIRVDRTKKLYAKQAIDKDSMDAAFVHLLELQQRKIQYQANLELAKLGSREDRIKAQAAQVASLTEKVKVAQWDLSQKTINAPTSGVIFDIYFTPGEYVPAQQPVLALLPPENMYIVFFMPLRFLQKIHLQQAVQFTCEGCKKNNPAVINYISPVAEYLPPLVYSRENEDKLVFRIHAQVTNPLDFKSGQPVTVSIT